MAAERASRWRAFVGFFRRSRRRALQRRLAQAQCFLAERGFAQLRASERDLPLLLRQLSPSQREEFARHYRFTVRGASGREYLICYGTAANIHVAAEAPQGGHRLCAGPADLSAPAMMLAQKVMLETREAEFLDIAIRHPPLPGRQAPSWLDLDGAR